MTENISEKLNILHKKCKIDGLMNSLIHIPAGEFLYGRKKESKYLDEFYIMKYPVTVKQYRQYCKISYQKMPAEPKWGWHDSHPIVNVNWFDAVAFAEFVGLVLPFEEEWEKVARGVDGRIFPWGNEWDESKCCNSEFKTTEVGLFHLGISPYGIYDMAGNVWEWCNNLCDKQNGHEDDETYVRGGSWFNENPDFYRTFSRCNKKKVLKSHTYGFRCILKKNQIKLTSFHMSENIFILTGL